MHSHIYSITRYFRHNRDMFFVVLLLIALPLLLVGVQLVQDLRGRAFIVTNANILINASVPVGPLPHTWRALAQGGEEKGVRMLEPVIDDVSVLTPRYIRIDHIYDFYDVVSRDSSGNLLFSWEDLDMTVCDILATGAKPFFSLGYMPESMSSDGSLIGMPSNWGEWELLVQKTIERYSDTNAVICGPELDSNLDEVYYEVWNEPDLESFGKWSIHGGKDYKLLYYYSAKGAEKAVNTRTYFFGGPATTAVYQNWIQLFVKYAQTNNLKLDFLSWHHYGTNANTYAEDMQKVNSWLSGPEYGNARNLPRVISEWGYDSNPNPVSETPISAAHTVASIRYLVEENLEMAFAFEIIDGINPSWGMIGRDGLAKPRYHALRLLNILGRTRLALSGEGTYVKALASRTPDGVAVIIVNYDPQNAHTETVPLTIDGLDSGLYVLTREWLSGEKSTINIRVDQTGKYLELFRMDPNSIVAISLVKI